MMKRIDTGACMTMQGYYRHCQGYAPLDQRKPLNMIGIGGVIKPSRGKTTLTLKVLAGDSTLEASGDAWVFDTLPIEVLLGLPFMKK